MTVTSYNGWPASKDPKAIGVNAAFEIHGHRFPGGVKAGAVEVVFTYLGEQLHARVEPIDADAVKDDWGFTFKMSANSPELLSCHSSATALDWNATRHPNGKRRTFTRAQAAEINRILDELRTDDGVRVVQWRALVVDGGCARSAPDEMHFEIASVSATQVQQVADRIRRNPTPTPAPQEDEDMPYNTVLAGDFEVPTSADPVKGKKGDFFHVAGPIRVLVPTGTAQAEAITSWGPPKPCASSDFDRLVHTTATSIDGLRDIPAAGRAAGLLGDLKAQSSEGIVALNQVRVDVEKLAKAGS